jgi:hypothetical protein
MPQIQQQIVQVSMPVPVAMSVPIVDNVPDASSAAPASSTTSVEQRLITTATSLCQKVVGEGLIAAAAAAAADGDKSSSIFFVTPVESSRWQEQCSKVISMLDGMLRSVGSRVS